MKIKILIIVLSFIVTESQFAETYIVINGSARTTQCSYTRMAGAPNYIRWEKSNINWALNENGCSINDNIKIQDLENAVKNGFYNWDTISTANINFIYEGVTNTPYGNDGENIIYWAEDDDLAFENGEPLGGVLPGPLAVTIMTVNDYNEILDVDIIFNGRDHIWKVDSSDPDIWAVTSHEVGHLIGLFHSEINNLPIAELPSMNYFYNSIYSRDVTFDDRVGASFLYGGNLIDDEVFLGNIYLKFTLNILPGKTLTIQPGSSLKMFKEASIRVEGKLNAIATSSQNISFVKYGNNGIWSGIYFLSGSEGTIKYCNVKDVWAIDGSAININNASPQIQNCVFENNTGYSGAIICENILNNQPIISGNIIRNNLSLGYGGGILIKNSTRLRIENNIITHNQAPYGGGIICYDSTNTVFLNNTIAYNNADNSGGGIYCDVNSDPIFMNNIIYGNSAPSGSNICIKDLLSDPVFLNCDIQGGITGFDGIGSGSNYSGLYENNIDEDPLFIDSESNDYRLSVSSLCIGAGIDSLEIFGTWYFCPIFDLEGNPRPYLPGFMPDMGAYESPLSVSGIQDYLSMVPKEYTLQQNFPNPFNPTTTIRYKIPARGFVTLKVYDVLGNEIATLVDEEKQAGSYGVEFNASTLSSSVYLYQLQAGDFVQTKKMLLLK